MNDRSTTAGKQPASMLDTKYILGAAIVGVKAFGMDVQMILQSIDIFLEQLHLTQADQTARPRAADTT